MCQKHGMQKKWEIRKNQGYLDIPTMSSEQNGRYEKIMGIEGFRKLMLSGKNGTCDKFGGTEELQKNK